MDSLEQCFNEISAKKNSIEKATKSFLFGYYYIIFVILFFL